MTLTEDRPTYIRYPYANNAAGELVYIEDRKEDDKFTCLCCGTEMIPKWGQVRIHHFSHKALSPNCKSETALHFTAKAVLEERFEKGGFPSIYYPCPFCSRDQLFDMTDCDRLSREEYVLGIRPDLTFFVGDKIKAVLEIVVSHDIEPSTLTIYRQAGIKVIVWKPTWETLHSHLKAIHARETWNIQFKRCEACEIKRTEEFVTRSPWSPYGVPVIEDKPPTTILEYVRRFGTVCEQQVGSSCGRCPKYVDNHCDTRKARLYREWKKQHGLE